MPSDLSNLYWMLLGAAFFAACGVVILVARGRLDGRLGAALTIVAMLLLLVAGRWPSVYMPSWLNPDESLMLAQAMKLQVSPIPWHSIDTGTGGPINSYALLPIHWLGIDYGYPLARLTALACLSSFIVLTYFAMRSIAGAVPATIAILPSTSFHALSTDVDFLHYSSELASITMIALLTLAASRLPRHPPATRRDDIGAIVVGICAFLVSMAKLQGLPLGAALCLCLLALVSADWRIFLRRLVMVMAGGAVATTALLLVLALSGAVDDFYVSFVQLPFAYSSEPLTFQSTMELVHMRGESRYFLEAMQWLLPLALLVTVLVCASKQNLVQLSLRLISLLLIAGATYATLSQSGRLFPHYTQYLSLTGAWMLLLSLPWSEWRKEGREANP